MAAQGAVWETGNEVLSSRDLENQIMSRVGRRIQGLSVIDQEHGFVLRGRVANFYLKQLAQQAAMELGAAIVANDIEVT